MAVRRNYSDQPKTIRRPPAVDPEEREKQMISLAMDVAEKQLRNGTASSQVITHFLKLATVRSQLELEKTKKETAQIEAKTQALKKESELEELYIGAMDAMRAYGGSINHDGDEDDEED